MKADEESETHGSEDENDSVSEDNALDVEMALLAIAATNDIGGPMGEFDLTSLSLAEKRALLTYLRHRFNMAPDPCDLSDCDASEKEPGGDLPKSKPE